MSAVHVFSNVTLITSYNLPQLGSLQVQKHDYHQSGTISQSHYSCSMQYLHMKALHLSDTYYIHLYHSCISLLTVASTKASNMVGGSKEVVERLRIICVLGVWCQVKTPAWGEQHCSLSVKENHTSCMLHITNKE